MNDIGIFEKQNMQNMIILILHSTYNSMRETRVQGLVTMRESLWVYMEMALYVRSEFIKKMISSNTIDWDTSLFPNLQCRSWLFFLREEDSSIY